MTQHYERLYHRDSNDNLRVWWMERDEGSYRTHAGIDGGAIVTSDWKVIEGKNIGRSNETAPAEQADLQIKSLYRSKLEKKYSTDPATAGRRNFLEPQLANKFGPKYLKKKMLYWHTQPKLDGIRSLVDGATTMSRAGKPFITVQHIVDELAHFCAAYNVTVDGELYNHELKDDFEQIQSFVKKQKLSSIPEPTMEQIKDMVQFHVYDVIMHDNEQATFLEREAFLDSELFNNPNYLVDKIIQVKSRPFHLDIDSIDEFHDQEAEKGYEGIMLRNPLAPYTFGRSDNLLKHKMFVDGEFRIKSITEGTGNWAGKARIAEVEDLETGVISKADIKGSMDKLVDVLARKDEFIDKITTVVYQNKTKNGKLRFAKVKAIYDNGRDS